MKRYGSIIGLKPDKAEEYMRLHGDVWASVQHTMTMCNIRNYTIFRYGPWLFSYFEYVGTDYASDVERMNRDPDTLYWWSLCEPCQNPLDDRESGEWWASMEELYHQD